MHDRQSLAHVRWECKYQVVIIKDGPRTRMLVNEEVKSGVRKPEVFPDYLCRS